MMNGGEAADQMVSYAFKGGEVVLRLSGSAAKHLAIYLANLLKQGGPSKGKTTLKHMIADGSPLKVQRVRVEDIPYFNEMAKKYGVMFVAVKDKNQRGGSCDIMFRTDDAARVDRIFDRLAISDHPDVAHIKSEIFHDREEGRQEQGENANPTRTARDSSPSRKPSPAYKESDDELPSVEDWLSAIRGMRLDDGQQTVPPVKPPHIPDPTKEMGR